MNIFIIIMFSLVMITGVGYLCVSYFFLNQITSMLQEEKNKPPMVVHTMSFEDCNSVIDTVIQEIYGNKYLLNYRLKQIKIIPDLETEAINLTKEIIAAFSQYQLDCIYKYYSYEYFIQMITRRVQLLLIEYTDKYKPTTK